MSEEWRKIDGYPNYSVSNFGQVRNDKTNKILIPNTCRPYKRIILCNKGVLRTMQIHRLVALSFLKQDPFKLRNQVNHKDLNKFNNHLSNLEWVTGKENSQHAIINNRTTIGERHGRCKLSDNDILKIKELRASGLKVLAIANIYNVSHQHISGICRGKYRFKQTN